MGYTIAIAGKGGTGKTTIAALLIRLIKENRLGSILAVDADPNSNLAELLGVEIEQTIVGILDTIARHPDKVPAGMPKERFIEYQVQTVVKEADGFDIISMGKPEGPGCYCYVNNVLRNIMGKLVKDYDYTIIDNEAGFEHLSRRTSGAADALLVIADATAVGLKAAARISAIVKELGIKTKNNFLLVNRWDKEIEKEKIEKLGLQYIGNIPMDEDIAIISLNGTSLWGLKNNALSISALRKIGDKIWQAN